MPTKRIFVPDLDDSDDLLAYLTDVARNTVLPEDLDKALPDYQFLTWVQNSSNADKMTVRIEYMSTNAPTCIVRYLISYIQSPSTSSVPVYLCSPPSLSLSHNSRGDAMLTIFQQSHHKYSLQLLSGKQRTARRKLTRKCTQIDPSTYLSSTNGLSRL